MTTPNSPLTRAPTNSKPLATSPLGSGNQAVLADVGTRTVTRADRLGTGQLAIKTTDLTLT
ncbi:hypothetical protein [Streptomyces inhibens]|uniref:hypothetical protein n=1 Tax=Streptomyces inhibens TaxID=2293571 RepID=UPI003CC83038